MKDILEHTTVYKDPTKQNTMIKTQTSEPDELAFQFLLTTRLIFNWYAAAYCCDARIFKT